MQHSQQQDQHLFQFSSSSSSSSAEVRCVLLATLEDCAKCVYEALGSGYSESVYHRAMEVELRHRGLIYESKVTIPIVYKGLTVGYGEGDLIVYGEQFSEDSHVIVELKATSHEPREVEKAQIIGYLRCRGLALSDLDGTRGLIVNFPQPTRLSPMRPNNSIDLFRV
jgi:GxxExxY protein